MKLYFIAGEASGDLHGANLIKALRAMYPPIECRAWGGDRMAEAGATLVKHYRDLAFMGFWEVLKNLPTIWQYLAFCQRDIAAFRPDAIILIDYPGFNLRIARWAKSRGYRVIYYISPQIWAWHVGRVRHIRRDVDLMLVILPFEADFYRKYGIEVSWVGHPLLDALPEPTPMSREKLIVLLPGSRQQEVHRILPTMLSVRPLFPEYRFAIAGAPGLPESIFRSHLAAYPDVDVCFGNTYGLLQRAQAAIVKSGTSTLEAALLDVPQVVCYIGSALSYALARRVVRVPYISLVNLILDRPLVRELIQGNFTTATLQQTLEEILEEEGYANIIHAGYGELRQRLGGPGASHRAATAIIDFLRKAKHLSYS